MKITIQKTTTKEIEITFPHFRKSTTINWYYAIWDEKSMTRIIDTAVLRSDDIESAFDTGTIETTRQEFMQRYEIVVDEINNDFDNVVNAMALIADEEDKYLRDNFDATNEPNMDHINA